jgi:hypothetical protein
MSRAGLRMCSKFHDPFQSKTRVNMPFLRVYEAASFLPNDQRPLTGDPGEKKPFENVPSEYSNSGFAMKRQAGRLLAPRAPVPVLEARRNRSFGRQFQNRRAVSLKKTGRARSAGSEHSRNDPDFSAQWQSCATCG